MKIDPVAILKNSGIAVVFVAGLASYAGPAVGATSSDCSTHASDRITSCFLDLTKTPAPPSGGMFVGTSADLGTGMATPVSTGLQPSVTSVMVCDYRGDSTSCARYYEFQLDANEGVGGANSSVWLDQFKVFTSSSGSTTPPSLRYDMDGGPEGDVSVLLSPNNPDGNEDLQALISVSSFSRLRDDTFVYVHSTFRVTGKCQEGIPDSPCPTPGGDTGSAAAAVSLPSTALLLGIGLVGMVRIRRRRSPDLGVPH